MATSSLEMTSGSGLLLGTDAKHMLSMEQAHALLGNFSHLSTSQATGRGGGQTTSLRGEREGAAMDLLGFRCVRDVAPKLPQQSRK